MSLPNTTDAAPGPDGVRGLLSDSGRRSIYALLITISTGMMLARIARVDSADPKSPTPFLSANDRSRWAAIRALVDEGTFAIDNIIFDGKGNRVRGWHTIDLVKHRGPDGRQHYYSSKPTLLTTLLAGEYWLVKALTGATLAEQPHYVARIMLVLTNVVPLAIALALLGRLFEPLGGSDWGRVFAMAAASVGTFMTTFAVTLNNHLIAAVCLVVALAAIVPILRAGGGPSWRFVVAGLSLAFLASSELPALSILVLGAVGLLWQWPRQTLVGFVPAALVVAAGAFGTNYIAHGDWKTPYAHRRDGPVITAVPDAMAVYFNVEATPAELLTKLRAAKLNVSDNARIEVQVSGERWLLWDEPTRTELVLQRTVEGSRKAEIEVRRHDNWYDYEGSYWQPKNLRGIDVGEQLPLLYAFHALIGHHGIFSLTPIWLLSVAGCWLWLRRSHAPEARNAMEGVPYSVESVVAATTVVISIVVVGFYLTRPQIDRNYGGGTCCLRWLIWLTPLWLVTMLPALDRIACCRWGRGLAVALLVVSVFSAAYAAGNPWSHPWIFDYWTAMGWIHY